MRVAVTFLLLAAAFAGCAGRDDGGGEGNLVAGGEATFRYLCPGATGDGAAEPCLTQLPRGEAALQQPYIAIHPGNPEIMAVGVHYAAPAAELALDVAAGDASANRLAVYITDDGGATWRETFASPPSMSADPLRIGGQGDAALLFDPDGRLHVTAVATPGTPTQQAYTDPRENGQRVYYAQSDDLGNTWSDSVLLQDNGLYQERNWIVRDPVDGTLFVTWLNYPAVGWLDTGHVQVASSLDAGVTWRNQQPEQGAPCYRAGMPVVLQGTLRFACKGLGPNGSDVVQVYRFDAERARAVLIAELDAEGSGGQPFPSLALLADGTLAMYYNTDTSTPLLRSPDGGITWHGIGAAMDFADQAWDRGWVFASEADRMGGQHLLVRFNRADSDLPLPSDPLGAPLGWESFELRHVVLHASGAIDNVVLATWRTVMNTVAGQVPGNAAGVEGEGHNRHPRCGGSSCSYSMAWVGDEAMFAFSHGGTVELGALQCSADCILIEARILDAETMAAEYVPPTRPPGLDEPVEYEFTGHVNFPGCYAEADPALDAAVRDRVEFEFEVPANTRFVNATLDWEMQQPVADLDLYLYNSNGDLFRGDDGVPERFSFEIAESDQGTWTALVQNCENPPTDFTLDLVLS